MSQTSVKSPTEAELEILHVLWERGEATVREVHEALSEAKGYTTVLKLMQLMAEKGLVLRDESQRSHLYRSAIAAEPTKRKLVRRFIENVFSGSTSELIHNALSSKRATPQELAEIRRMLDEAERGER